MILRLLVCLQLFLWMQFGLMNQTAGAQAQNKSETESVLPNFDPPPIQDRLIIEFPAQFENRETQWALEDALIAALETNVAGTFDGPLQALDGSLTYFYIYSHDIPKAVETVVPVLQASGFSKGVVIETMVNLENGEVQKKRLALD